MTQSAEDTAWCRASERCSFQLTYDRADEPRTFTPGWLSGASIPDAHDPTERSPGEWMADHTCDDDVDEAGWVDKYASYAIHEAVHEALEWFRVDGKMWLDPHGPDEDVICHLVDELVAKLARLRKED
jgi:hypothetical protein